MDQLYGTHIRKKDINKLESIGKRGARFITIDYKSCNDKKKRTSASVNTKKTKTATADFFLYQRSREDTSTTTFVIFTDQKDKIEQLLTTLSLRTL